MKKDPQSKAQKYLAAIKRTEDKLFPCPLCNGKVRLLPQSFPCPGYKPLEGWSVDCGICRLKMDIFSRYKAQVLASWNRRPNLPIGTTLKEYQEGNFFPRRD